MTPGITTPPSPASYWLLIRRFHQEVLLRDAAASLESLGFAVGPEHSHEPRGVMFGQPDSWFYIPWVHLSPRENFNLHGVITVADVVCLWTSPRCPAAGLLAFQTAFGVDGQGEPSPLPFCPSCWQSPEGTMRYECPSCHLLVCPPCLGGPPCRACQTTTGGAMKRAVTARGADERARRRESFERILRHLGDAEDALRTAAASLRAIRQETEAALGDLDDRRPPLPEGFQWCVAPGAKGALHIKDMHSDLAMLCGSLTESEVLERPPALRLCRRCLQIALPRHGQKENPDA